MLTEKVAIIMGSESDYKHVENSVRVLKDFNVPVEVRVLSAHRTPKHLMNYVAQFEANNIEVVIAVAGKAAHLAGVIASYTSIPVIGVPIQSSSLDGMDALLATVQMPTGIPVATVAINGCENAALLAIQILSVKQKQLRIKMIEYREKMTRSVLEKDMLISSRI